MATQNIIIVGAAAGGLKPYQLYYIILYISMTPTTQKLMMIMYTQDLLDCVPDEWVVITY